MCVCVCAWGVCVCVCVCVCVISAVDCGSIEPTGAATFTPPTDTGLGSSFEFRCMYGFNWDGTSSAGNFTVTCQQNGRWGLGNLTCNGETGCFHLYASFSGALPNDNSNNVQVNMTLDT